MSDLPFEMRFDPRTIKHLGVRMYSTLPPALAEIVSNAYDADATNVLIRLKEDARRPISIQVEDDGDGLSFDEINEKFLIIGRNRRDSEGDRPSKKYRRLPTGKKGLGKLALFGLASTITIHTRQNGRSNSFVLDWEELLSSEKAYRPRPVFIDKPTDDPDGTVITLDGLKRKTAFNVEGLADSLSRIFIFDDTFNLTLVSPAGKSIQVDNTRRYTTLSKEFEWSLESSTLVPESSPYAGRLTGRLLTSEKPIPPSSGLRGITLFSRGKLVNAPEFFSASTSSHFFQYLTGWIAADFIDLLAEDVIATNRQSIDWEHPEMSELRDFLSGMVSQINIDWRSKRKKKKKDKLRKITGIDTDKWVATLSDDVKENAEQIINSLGGEDALERYTPVIKALHGIIPEYPKLHWRHLHATLRDRVEEYYQHQQYADAASQGVQIYCEKIRDLTGKTDDGVPLVSSAFGKKPFDSLPLVQLNELATVSEKNIQEGQGHMSRGVVVGFRNPISHAPLDSTVPKVFSELDCLNVLSLVSYLLTRLDNVKINNVE